MCTIVVEGVPSETLAPGDVLVVPPSGMDVPCDAVLLSGQAIVNEAMLTGKNSTYFSVCLSVCHTHFLILMMA